MALRRLTLFKERHSKHRGGRGSQGAGASLEGKKPTHRSHPSGHGPLERTQPDPPSRETRFHITLSTCRTGCWLGHPRTIVVGCCVHVHLPNFGRYRSICIPITGVHWCHVLAIVFYGVVVVVKLPYRLKKSVSIRSRTEINFRCKQCSHGLPNGISLNGVDFAVYVVL